MIKAEELHVNDKDWVAFGEQRSAMHESFKQCGWNSKQAQTIRFQKFAELIEPGDVVLDVGCGTADFYAFMKRISEANRSKPIDYYGTDLSADLLAVARQKHPEIEHKLFNTDIIADREIRNGAFDVVVASGIFSMRNYKSLEYLDLMIRQMFDMSTTLVAFNLLSTFADEIKEGSRYWSPSEVIMLIQKYTKSFKIDHSYLPHDFTVVMYKS